MIIPRAWTGLKPGVFDAPLRGFRGLTPAPAREAGISAVDGSSCPGHRRRSHGSSVATFYFAPATAISAVHLRLSRINALATMTIFRMMATIATFAGFPSWRNASYFSLS